MALRVRRLWQGSKIHPVARPSAIIDLMLISADLMPHQLNADKCGLTDHHRYRLRDGNFIRAVR